MNKIQEFNLRTLNIFLCFVLNFFVCLNCICVFEIFILIANFVVISFSFSPFFLVFFSVCCSLFVNSMLFVFGFFFTFLLILLCISLSLLIFCIMFRFIQFGMINAHKLIQFNGIQRDFIRFLSKEHQLTYVHIYMCICLDEKEFYMYM